MKKRRRTTGGWPVAGAAAIGLAGCARLVGLDLQGWEHKAPAACAWPSDEGSGEACCGSDGLCSPASGEPAECAPLPWADAKVAYRFAEDVPACDASPAGGPPCFRERVETAMAGWCEATAGALCFGPWQGEGRVVTIGVRPGACYAAGGGGHQPTVWLDPEGTEVCDGAGYAHALGHALGLVHAYQRPDRDRYLTFAPEQLACDCADDALRTCGPHLGAFETFDYASIMMYPTAASAPLLLFDKQGGVLRPARLPSRLDGSALLQIAALSVGWQPFAPLGATPDALAPLDPQLPGGATIVGSPAAVVVSPLGDASALHLVVRGSNGHLYEKITPRPWTQGPDPRPSFAASPWLDLGGEFDSDPAASTSSAGDRLYLAARRIDGQIYLREGANGGWVSVGAPSVGAASAPALAAASPGRLDVVLRGADNRGWKLTRETGRPANWVSSPIFIEGKPAIVSRGQGRLSIVAKVPGEPRLLHLARSPQAPECYPTDDWWCPLTYPAGGVIEGPSPALVATEGGDLELFAMRAGSLLSQTRYHDAWAPTWTPLGGYAQSDPAAAIWPDGTITLYLLGRVSLHGDAGEEPSAVLLERSWRPPATPLSP
jgi:Astacin (Peptidase family M12A)